MSDINKLCKDLNDRVFQYEVLYVDLSGEIATIKFLPIIKPRLVKALQFDDLIAFTGHTPIFTTRLQSYAKELSSNIVANNYFLYY